MKDALFELLLVIVLGGVMATVIMNRPQYPPPIPELPEANHPAVVQPHAGDPSTSRYGRRHPGAR